MSFLTYLGIGFLAYRIGLEQGKKETGKGTLTLEGILNDLVTRGKLTRIEAQAILDSVARGASDPTQVLSMLAYL